MGAYRQDEIAASVAAHRDLGPGYEDAVATGLVERIGEEIDKRIDARLGVPQEPVQAPVPRAVPGSIPAAAPARRYLALTFLALGSVGLGVAATAVALKPVYSQNGSAAMSAGQIILAMFIWTAIAVINVAYARHR